MDLKIKNRIALVTGGASGIGKAVVLKLLEAECKVYAVSRSEKSLNLLKNDCKIFGNKLEIIHSDLNQEGIPTKIVNDSYLREKSIDIVVNNIGDTLNITDPYCSAEEWQKLFRLILGVAIEINNTAIPLMTIRKWGRIVNITAGASMENSGPVPYCSLKAAFTAYSRSMARVLASDGTGVVMTAVLPGVVLTENGHWAKVLKENPNHAKNYLQERTVLKRFGIPEEVSPIIALLCSELASFCIGSVIPVEGGQSRHYFQKVDDF